MDARSQVVGAIIAFALALASFFLFFPSAPPSPNWGVTGAGEDTNLSIWNGSAWVPYGVILQTCYQESANVSTACGGLATGSYSATGWYNSSPYLIRNLYDENWTTYTWPIATNAWAYLIVNYTKPSYTTAVIWQVKERAGSITTTTNLTLPSGCFSGADVLLNESSLTNSSGWQTALWSCYNGTGYQLLRNQTQYSGSNNVYEEGVYWISNGTESATQMRFRCTNPPSICQPSTQNNATGQAILRNHNNGTGNSTFQEILGNTTWGTTFSQAELRCGTNASGPAANTNVTTSWANYSTSNLSAGATQDIYCFLNLTTVGADFPRSFNLTVRNG